MPGGGLAFAFFTRVPLERGFGRCMKALVALTVGSPFLIIAPHREITTPDSAGVLDTGLWKPGCSTVEAEPSHGASRQELEEGCGGG